MTDETDEEVLSRVDGERLCDRQDLPRPAEGDKSAMRGKFKFRGRERVSGQIATARANFNAAVLALERAVSNADEQTVPVIEPNLDEARMDGWLAAIIAVSSTPLLSDHESARAAVVSELERKMTVWCDSRPETHTLIEAAQLRLAIGRLTVERDKALAALAFWGLHESSAQPPSLDAVDPSAGIRESRPRATNDSEPKVRS